MRWDTFYFRHLLRHHRGMHSLFFKKIFLCYYHDLLPVILSDKKLDEALDRCLGILRLLLFGIKGNGMKCSSQPE